MNKVNIVITSILIGRLEARVEGRIGESNIALEREVNNRCNAYGNPDNRKCDEHGIDLHILFIDFKQPFDSVIRHELVKEIRKIEVTEKVVRLVRMIRKDLRRGDD